MKHRSIKGENAIYPWTPERIRALRKRYGQHQSEFAEHFRLRIGAIQNWEQGKGFPSGPAQVILDQLEEALQTEPEPIAG